MTARAFATGAMRTGKSDASGQFTLAGYPQATTMSSYPPRGFRLASHKFSLKVAGSRGAFRCSGGWLSGSDSRWQVQTAFAGGGWGRRGRCSWRYCWRRTWRRDPHGSVISAASSNSRLCSRRMAMALNAPVANAKLRSQATPRLKCQSPATSSLRPRAYDRYFPEALYINPEIITDQNGAASIVIPMADSITTWRMAMIASTPHGALGSGTSSLKVFQDFFVDLDLPVTLTQGDRVSIPVAIYNYSGARGEVNSETANGRLVLAGRRHRRKDDRRWIPAASADRNSPSKPSASANSN